VGDIAIAGAVILFAIGWYGLMQLAAHFHPSQRHASLVWCASVKCMSLIETEPSKSEEKSPPAVSSCLLWPQLHDCDQRCIR
jgi:hypothetical protein